MVAGSGAATETAAPAPAGGAAPDGAVGEDDHVELALEVARIEGRRIHHFEGKFVLLEKPARPAGWHGAAVLIVEADADGLELQGVAGGRLGHRVDGHAEFVRALFEHGAGGGGCGNPDGSGAEVFAIRRRWHFSQ